MYSFVNYLKKKNYSTIAYYPVYGGFFSARKAYGHYGFSRFLDSRDLKLPKTWLQFSDDKMAEIIVKHLPSSDLEPFFAYAVLLENHSPHPCRNFTQQNQFETTLVGEFEFGTNCELNEYLKRLRSTESAIARMIAKLQEEEKKNRAPLRHGHIWRPSALHFRCSSL